MSAGALMLAAGEVLRLASPRGREIDCDGGQQWSTEEAPADDVWLAPGQRVRLVGEGLALVEAKGDARLRVVGSRAAR